MEKILNHSDIDMFTENTIKNNKNAYIVDFTKDIDIEKSDYYELNEENNCLTFSHQTVKEIKPEDFYVVSGEIQPIKEGFKLVALPDSKIPAEEKQRAIAISKEPINLKTSDSLYISHERNENIVYLGLVSKFYYEQTMKFLNNKITFEEWTRITRTNEESIRIVNELGKNKFSVYRQNGNQKDKSNSVDIFNKKVKLDYLINFSDNYSLLPNKKKLFLNDEYIKDTYHLIFIYYSSLYNKEAKIMNLKLVKPKGLIYLRQLPDLGKYLKVKVLYSGDVRLQYFSDKRKSWEYVKDNLTNIKDITKLRIEMNSSSKIYKLIVCEEK